MECHLLEMKIDVLIPHKEGNFGVGIFLKTDRANEKEEDIFSMVVDKTTLEKLIHAFQLARDNYID